MFLLASGFILLVPCIFLLRLIFTYLWDKKGFRKYPNQNLASGLTPLAYGWECGRKHPIFHTKRLHDRLQKDPVIRIGPNWLTFGRSQAARDIYGYTSKCRKAAPYDLMAAGGKHLNNITEKSVHSARRRMVASFYSPKNFDTWEPKVASSVTMLVAQLDKSCTSPPTESRQLIPKEELSFDACHWMWLYSVEATIKLMLSKDVFFLVNGTDHVYFKDADGKDQAVRTIHNMHATQRAASTVIWDVDNFPLWHKLTTRFSKTYAENWQGGPRFHQAMEALVKERIQRHNDGEILDDLFHPLLENSKGVEPDISMEDRIAEVEQNVGAATDGAAVSIAMTLYYLLRNPSALLKLRIELSKALSPSDTIAPWSKVKSLPYLRACLDESMRLAPPVATELIRLTPPDTSVVIDGVQVPPNTNVSMAAYTAHHDPAVFEDPEVYMPERWMAKGSDELKAMLAAFMPFTAGTRACIGRNISLQMQNVCLATVIYHFDFALPHESWEMEFEEWFNLWPLGLPLKVWRRDPEAASLLPENVYT